jgi:ribonuclease P protein component
MIKTVPIKNYEFLKAYKKGKFYVGKFIILYTLPNKLGINRLGITTSKKVGKSVIRNRVRRLIKESYRVYESSIKESFDYIFVARNSEVLPSFVEIKREMKFLFKKLNVYNQEQKD